MVSQPNPHYVRHYSEEGFWIKLRDHALSAGKVVVEKALTLYYCAIDPATPVWAKSVIFAALGYFILPLDLIPDVIPVGGFTDDLGVLVGAVTAVLTHVRPEHTEHARQTMKQWFGTPLKGQPAPAALTHQ